jgi:hypothetical protein|tara:strand:+ start:168 stop:398 length:231 start_codon:yes stop_codon:yes gene_type:complete
MDKTKAEESQELSVMVDEYLNKGGVIHEIPVGMSGNDPRLHGLIIAPKKSQLFGLSRHSKSRPGFHREKILLNEKN